MEVLNCLKTFENSIKKIMDVLNCLKPFENSIKKIMEVLNCLKSFEFLSESSTVKEGKKRHFFYSTNLDPTEIILVHN